MKRKAPGQKNKSGVGFFKKPRFFIFLVWFFYLLLGAGVVYAVIAIKTLPSPDQFNLRQINQSTKIYDRTGEVLLYEIHGEEKRTVVPLEEIPETTKNAVLAAEDNNFYTRPAFEWRAIVRAIFANFKEGKIVQGGSTITQQLARNIFLTPRKTLDRKFKELVLAIELESKYKKDEILFFYLNQVPFGSNAYGVEAASQTYFNKPIQKLTLAESAVMASMLKAPSYYSPWGTHQKELFERQSYVLDRMAELGYATTNEISAAKLEKMKFAPPSLGTIKAPHFSLAVKDYLAARYGEDVINSGGLKVITTLDWGMQEIAERVVKEGALRNEELYKGKNASLVAQDPKTGQILALVGSRDYFNEEIEGNFNVATQGLRQPGSALKPFAYLTAFEKGFSPKTIVFDLPTEFDTTGDPEKSYRPHNFDDFFRGPVAFETGLAQSINVPSVKVLYLTGLDNVLKTLHDFGITTIKERWRYGLSLILGGGEVRLIDLVNAYATLSQEGVKHEQAVVLKIENQNGETLESFHDKTERAIEETRYPKIINQILSDVGLRSPLFQNSLNLTVFEGREVALKTGTTNDYRDAWAMGYTPSLAVGVWAGNNDNKPLERHGGSILAAVPIWSAFLKEVLSKYPQETFVRPEPVELPTKPMLNGQFVTFPAVNGKIYPQIHSILYYVNKEDPLGKKPDYPANDSQFYSWETTVLSWGAANIPNFYEYNQFVPEFNGQQPQNDPMINNFSPKNGDFVTSPLKISANLSSLKQLKGVELYINKLLIDKTSLSGNSFLYQKLTSETLGPQNTIELKVENAAGEISSIQSIVFR